MALMTQLRADFCSPHNPVHTVFPTSLAMIFQIIGDIVIAIGTATFKPELLDQSKQPVVFNTLSGRSLKIGIYHMRSGITMSISPMEHFLPFPSSSALYKMV